jgi:gliding motility-associated-like protein
MEIKAFYQSHFRVPNVFTPNSDGINDYFYVIAGRDVKKINLFQVINRWGEKVFETQNAEPNTYQFGWDGTKNNKPLPQGTYVYYIVIELIDGRNETYKGNITLVR